MKAPLIELLAVSKRFAINSPPRLGQRRTQHWLHAVDDLTLSIADGESVGLVGESGCGKSTLARIIARLIDPTDGRLLYEGRDIGSVPAARFARDPARGKIQMVFQDATDSIDPRFVAQTAIDEPLRRLGRQSDHPTSRTRVLELADAVNLPRELLHRYPHQLSGGQKARVGIARALALNPGLLILDEPTAALDVSVQAVILKLLAELRARLGIAYLFVSHDLEVVRLLCERVVVMYLGRIVESAPATALFAQPSHPYTHALLSAAPRPGRDATNRIRLEGEPLSPIDPDPNVCRFYGRCPRQADVCRESMPSLRTIGNGHAVACHFPLHG